TDNQIREITDLASYFFLNDTDIFNSYMIIGRFCLPFFPSHIRKRLFFLNRRYNLMRIVIVFLNNQRRMRIFMDDMLIYVSPAGVIGFTFNTKPLSFSNELYLVRFAKQL